MLGLVVFGNDIVLTIFPSFVGRNQVEGEIPSSIGGLEELTYLDLGKKSCGRLVLYQPAFVSHSRSYVSGKNITGENRFTGQIPVFGGLGKLTHLDLGKE